MDPLPQSVSLFITHVDKEGPFLKVWGQTEKNNSIYVEQFLLSASQQFDQGIGILPFDALQVNTLVCAKYKDNKYYRSRIVSILKPYFVEVYFLDYGNRDIVPTDNIRSIQSFPTSFISIPPLSTGFIIAEAHCPGGGEWKDQIFDLISKELNYREVRCNLLTKATNSYLVKLFIENTDLGTLFINRGLLQPIPLHAQQAVLLSMSLVNKATTPLAAPIAPPAEINTYKACTLEPMQQYAVYVSFVNEGPTHFSVQLQQSETVLAKLMKEINEVGLRLMEDVPLPGTICLAKCQEDDNVCRAVVTNEVDNQFKVFYVDFGNYETLPLECLFQIPFKYVLPKVMAIRVALNGVEKSTVTIDMRLAFKKFVDNRLLYMKVLPSSTKTVIPKCELWDPETKTSALDVINRAAQHAYPEPLLLNRGFTQPVKVSYVFSCNRFFVQLLSKEQELAKLMNDLQTSCQTSESIYDIKIGLPCCALFESDQLWYRSEIVDAIDSENVKVKYIDYGNEEVLAITDLRIVEGELLTVLRPQAIECCLNGYQNMGIDEDRDALFEHLILEQNFSMKVTEMHGKKALVELIDENNYNVASLLLDKIATSKSQVSPMLVHADNTLQHRKSSDSSDNYKTPKKPAAREWNRNDVTELRNDKSHKPWRTDNKDTGENETNSNDRSPDSGSWRQNNKNFNHNDRDKLRDRGDGDRGDRGYRDRGDRRDRDWSDRSERADRDWADRGDKDRGERGDKDRSERGDRYRNERGGFRDKGDRDRPDRFDRVRGDKDQTDRVQKDRPSVNDRFNRSKNDKGNDNRSSNWNNKGDDVFENTHAWSSDVNEAKASEGSGWGDSTTSTTQDSHETDQPRDDKYSGRKKFEDRNNRQDAKSWNNKENFRKDGIKKSFKRDGSEISSSGSERSFRKGGRANSKFEQDANSAGRRFQNRSEKSYGSNSWSAGEVSAPIDAAPIKATFEQLDVVGSEEAVVISWFHNPGYFYCQMQSTQPEFKTLMEEIQQFYKGRKAGSSVVGAPVIGLFPEDSVLYRGQILEVLGNQYKVLYVDFGNVSIINKVWPIDKKFMQMPAQAICCGLRGIEPLEGNWPDPSTFSQYFGKECFMVSFLEKNENRIFVEMWDDQNQMSELLIQAKLATAVRAQITESIDISLLLSQQFRVVLKSVNNLNDIIIALECGLALTCKAHNLEMASESHEDVLKGYLEQTLIVYVDDIIENDQLEVTFYDNEGNKIDILSPDEGAYDNVEPLCQTFIISSQLKGFVSHVNETSVFIQPSIHSDQISILLDQLYEAYKSETEESTMIPEEGLVYAVHSSDGNWYRGRVDTFDDDKATITYVDYGNSETVPFSKIRVLTPKFNVPNMMCVKVVITSGSTSSFLEKEVVASIYFGEIGWEGTIQKCIEYENTDQSPAELNNIDQSSSHNTDASQQNLLNCEIMDEVQSDTATIDCVKEDIDNSLDTEHINRVVSTPLKGTPVYVSHIDTPTEFYVQFPESKAAIDELQEQLQQQADDLPALENASVGILCAAPYSVDRLWYRAEVLDADEDITTVRFVDFGNTDVINNKTTQVKTLPPNLLTLAVYATRCSLKLKSLEDEWNHQALALFEKLASQKNLQAEFLIQDEKTSILELYSNGTNVKDELLALNYAVPCEIITESKTTCFVSHLNSPSEFWVQMENCTNELEWIAEQLSGAEQLPELDDMAPGTLCAALFPDDEMWYRARILSNTIAGIELLFIDYGNSCISNSLRQLPEDIVVTPPLAQKCCLQKPEGILYWTKEAQDKFAEISAEGETIFELKKISSGETTTVELLLNSENIVPKILAVTQDGYLKNFESLNKFDLENNGDIFADKICLEPLPGMEWNEESNKKFSQIYPENSLFQVELLGEDCVRLYQNGADIRVGLGGVNINLNLLQCQNGTFDDLSVIKDGILETDADGDNLETTHINECVNQDQSGIISVEPSEISSATSSAFDNDVQNPGYSNLNVETSVETVKNRNSFSNDDTRTDTENPVFDNLEGDHISRENKQILQNNKTDGDDKLCSHFTKQPESSGVNPGDLKTDFEKVDNKPNVQNVVEVNKIRTETENLPNDVVNSDCGDDLVADPRKEPQSSSVNPSNEKTALATEEHKAIVQDKTEVDSKINGKEIVQINKARQENEQREQHNSETVKNTSEVGEVLRKADGVTSSTTRSPAKKTTSTPQKPTRSRPTSSERFPINHDDKIIPACASRTQSPLPLLSDDTDTPTSRPSSAQGYRISHDEKILPAVLSRPQTPLQDDSQEN